MSGKLFVVATPIGNLSDLSPRALQVLADSSAIICEDTRVTSKLLSHYGLFKPLLSYHHHSSPASLQKIIERLVKGDNLSYVSDAGTPGVADPVGHLVAAAAGQGVTVVPIPGASAVTAALSVSGFNSQTYIFFGWPPHKKGRLTFFKEVAANKRLAVLFESTHRIMKTLTELAKVLPERQLLVGRELTKVFETLYRGTATEVIKQLSDSSTKGEFVIVIEGKN